MSNLLSNAIKYNKEQGDVYIRVSHQQEGKKEYLKIEVHDTGTGISKEKLPQIFDRFYQIAEPGAKKIEGSGIGLALTKELVNLMNGEIEVKSELGVGSTFFIKLPITRNALMEKSTATKTKIVTKSEDPSPAKANSISNQEVDEEQYRLPNVLIVEDNPDIIQILIACLEDSYQLNVANNGQEGIDKALEFVPDAIVSDVMMPIKDGVELCNTLKKDERTSHIPIILLTAKTDLNSKTSGLENGADAYLSKPFEQEDLLAGLNKLLMLRQQAQKRYTELDFSEWNKNLTQEDIFIQKVVQLIEDNSSDSMFRTANLCQAVGFSRAQLHNKIIALTGFSTAVFMRYVRLKKAKQLLKTTNLNVDEVVRMVGFGDSINFSFYFEEQFGIPPTQL